MNKDICKYIKDFTLCKREKAIVQMCPLQMRDVPDGAFGKIATDLITDSNVSMSGNQHILIIIDNLTGWPESFWIPDKKTDTIVYVFINNLSTGSHVPQLYTIQ